MIVLYRSQRPFRIKMVTSVDQIEEALWYSRLFRRQYSFRSICRMVKSFSETPSPATVFMMLDCGRWEGLAMSDHFCNFLKKTI